MKKIIDKALKGIAIALMKRDDSISNKEIADIAYDAFAFLDDKIIYDSLAFAIWYMNHHHNANRDYKNLLNH